MGRMQITETVVVLALFSLGVVGLQRSAALPPEGVKPSTSARAKAPKLAPGEKQGKGGPLVTSSDTNTTWERRRQTDIGFWLVNLLGIPVPGELRAFAEYRLVVGERCEATFVEGAKETAGSKGTHSGQSIRVTHERVEEGRVRFDVAWSTPGGRADQEAPAPEPTSRARCTRKGPLGEWLNWGLVTWDRLWVELAVPPEVALGLTQPLPEWLLSNSYCSDPNQRMIELLNQSEELREIEKEWEKFWSND